jgi:histidinol-phosphate aminotransferase
MELSDSISLINERVRTLKRYHLEPETTDIKLNQNENPYDLPAGIKDEIAEFCRKRPFNRYPNFVPNALKTKLAGYAGVPDEGIMVGNGSNEILLVLLLSLSRQGGDVILCQPTFTVYRLLVTGLGAVERTVFLSDDLLFNVNNIRQAAQQYPRSLMVLCSPNNPTGCFLTETDIREILKVHTGFLVLDQAYVEFGGYDAIPLLKNNPNLIITRTFSKAFSGAGLRLGYLLGSPDVVQEINKIKLPYNINFFSEHVAQVMLNNTGLVQSRVRELSSRRDALFSFLATMPFEAVYPSAANFILMRSGRKNDLFASLKKNNILIRDVSQYPMLQNCLRVNVGTHEETLAFQSAVKNFFSVSAV